MILQNIYLVMSKRQSDQIWEALEGTILNAGEGISIDIEGLKRRQRWKCLACEWSRN